MQKKASNPDWFPSSEKEVYVCVMYIPKLMCEIFIKEGPFNNLIDNYCTL